MVEIENPICPIPGLGHCVRERCNFWDEDQEECTAACFGACDHMDASSKPNLDSPCVITFYEDND